MFDHKLFCATIQSRLLLRKISLREAAKEIGISASTISRIANGDQPDIETFAALIRWLDVNPGQFFGSSTSEAPGEDKWTALYYSLQTLEVPADLVEAVVTIIRLVTKKPKRVETGRICSAPNCDCGHPCDDYLENQANYFPTE